MHPIHLHYFPLPLIFYAIFAAVLLALFILLQLGLLRYAYMRIGLDSRVAMLILLGSLLGSYVNIPVAQLAEARVASDEVMDFFGMRYVVPVVVAEQLICFQPSDFNTNLLKWGCKSNP
jgi:uncharacterized membrane protein